MLAGGLSLSMPAFGQSSETAVSGHVHLDEVYVVARRPSVEQRGDTVVYNTDAFRLPQGAYLEALVRRIPGLVYDQLTRSITYHGHTITEIVLNGKEFFKDNRQVALENLPAEFISQIKVYDKATEDEKATGIKTGERHYVLDLKTRRQLDGSLVASAETGFGTHRKKDLNGQVFRFNDQGNNLSVVTTSTNRYATSSYTGNTDNTLGTNFTHNWGERVTLSASTDYRYDKQGAQTSSNMEQYLSYGNQYASSAGFALKQNHAWNARMELKWNIDARTQLQVSGSWEQQWNRQASDQRSAAFTQNPENDVKHPFEHFDEIPASWLINDNVQRVLTRERQGNYLIRTSLTRKTDAKGSNLQVALQTSGTNDRSKSFTAASTTYFRLTSSTGQDSAYYQHQYQSSPGRNQLIQASLSYTHALSRHQRIQLMYSLLLRNEHKQTATYDISPFAQEGLPIGYLPPDYPLGFADSLSSSNKGATAGHRFSLRYNYSHRGMLVTAGLSVQPQNRSIEQKKGWQYVDTTLHSVEWKPTVSFSYRSSRLLFTLGYAGTTRQPSLSHLVAPADYRSPLRIVKSNPDLKPSYFHQLSLTLHRPADGVTVAANWSQELNSITRATLYHRETGGIETLPVNVDGNWNLQTTVGYDRRIRSLRLYLTGGGSYFHTVSLLNEGMKEIPDRSCTGNASLNSTLRLSYLPSWGNIDLTGTWNFSRSRNSLRDKNTFARNYTLAFETTLQLPGHVQLSSDACYRSLSGTGIQGSENDEVIWNLRFSWRFLSQQRAELSVYWADILNEKKNYLRSVNAYAFSETYQEQLRSYLLVSLRYRWQVLRSSR